ncbi:hypothetical protein JTE90_026629 [Oedothorax gibbosus]|uniref:Nipped-B protein n=1 Tax=Oedothorax gibbosus TaxID=931172 RepID=A0AAV6U7U0_9ARAC|nr:hypothetical protein JTE90_026629 [Oedothorax gibbosus]
MMNGEGPSVPIITLAGIQGLTDLLVELPLPTPLPGVTAGHQSLLSHLRDPDEARRLINHHPQDPNVVSTLVEALANTDTDHIEVKDGYYGGGSHHGGQIPQLVQYLLGVNPGIFKGQRGLPQDHHGQWLARNASAATFNASNFSSPRGIPPEQNSPGYFPLDHSPYTPSVLHNNEGMQQNSPQMFHSALVNQQQTSPALMNCMDDNIELSNRTAENHILSTAQIISHLAPSLITPTATSLSTEQHHPQQHLLNQSPSVVKVPPPSSQLQCDFDQWQSPAQNSFQANSFPANNAYNVPTLMENSQPLLVPNSESLKENQAINHLDPKDRNENVCLPEPVIIEDKLKPVAEPLVVVPKLSIEDQLLAQRSVKQFIKTNKIPPNDTPEKKKDDKSKAPSSKASTDSVIENSRPTRAASSEHKKEKPTVNNIKPKDKKANSVVASNEKFNSTNEPKVVLEKLSLEDQLLAQKSVKQFIKAKKLPISPERSRQSSPNKVSETSRRRSSSNKEVDSNKSSPRRKSKNDDFFSSNRKNSDSNRSTKKSADTSDARGKKRKRGNQKTYAESSASENEKDDEDDSYKGASSPEAIDTFSTSQAKKFKNKKAKREPPPEPLSAEDLMDHSTYRNFSKIVDTIFDSMEEVDLSAMVDENTECAAEALIPLAQLQDLRSEVAKLKRLHAINQFPTERLVRLLAILGRNVVDGANLLPTQAMEEQDEDAGRMWLELTMERVMRSAEASLTALYVMTSPKVPEKVFLEDVIERIVHFLKFQLQNTVFPTFDPAYRFDPKSKDGYAGSMKQKRAHAHKVKERSTLQLYKKLHESVSLLAELLDLQTMTDTIILQVSTLGVSPFFVEGISELQLNALRLVTTVFSRYDKHRQLILEDILHSIARLPTSKRSLRNYRLNSEENIQMLTALVLQLIHSVVKLPDPDPPKAEQSGNEQRVKPSDTKEKVYIDKDVLIVTSYEASVSTAINFLSVFLKKCGTKNEEMDYRPLFEHFVQDLLSTVNKPEWPASELLLSVLGRILVRNFSNKSMDMTLRVASLDYLGVVAARLRKDAVTSQDRKDMINDVIQRIVAANEEQEKSPSKSKKKGKKKAEKQDEWQILQKALLQYLDANSDSDQSFQFCRKFYIAQWYYDAADEIKRSDKSLNFPKEESSDKPEPVVASKTKSPRSGRRSSKVAYEEEEEEEEEEEKEPVKEEPKLESDEVNAKVLALAEERKRFLLTVIKNQETTKVNTNEEEHIDYETAELISQYLSSNRNFAKSFDLYLSHILRVLGETAVAVRTKAMKCLALVVEADPGILSREDMQKGVHGRLLDQSTSVREAAIDLLGKFILIRPELISQYYEMLTDRILDTGVSVRKRVIKILKDICLEQPDFPKTSEICVKIIRRVNDEDGIKKLVGEVFQTMWFTPTSDKKPELILLKVKNITHVVEACQNSGLEWFEQLLTNLLKNKEDANYKSVIKSCKQIVDCLVENLLQLEESSQNVDGGASTHLVACLATLHLFSKIYPPFVVPHAMTVQPYLSMKCNSHSDYLLLKNVAQTLELVVPLIEHPSESFLAQIEEDMVKLILRQHMGLLPSCVSCLGAVVNRVTKNHQLVRDCFQKFFVVLCVCKKEHEKNPGNQNLQTMRPKLLRSLYTVGLFCQYFDFDDMEASNDQSCQTPLKQRVFEGIVYFNSHEDAAIRIKALTGLGFVMIRHYEFMLGPEVKTLYHYLLTSPAASCVLKCQVLKNITSYLVEEETRMMKKDAEWSKNSKAEDLKEMGDVTSGMASTVIQLYLKQVLDCVLHADVNVRKAALSVIQLILGQGLVHPVQILPYLVCLGSDDEPVLRTKADNLLQEIEKKYPGFIQMKAMLGVRMSYKMQLLIQSQDEILRGFRSQETPVARNGFLYSVMRTTRQSRRAFLFSLLKIFDEQAKTPLTELLYIADNIAYFPYMVQDEPLFIMHQLDIMLSVSGSNLLQSFREALLNRKGEPSKEQQNNDAASQPPPEEYYDEDEDDQDSILERLPEDTMILQECIIASQGCILLLYLKQTLKEMYGFTDNKIQQYSPNESAKVYERPLNRKGHVRFSPDTVLDFIKKEAFQGELDEEQKGELVEQYIHFKQLMLTIDPTDDPEDEDAPARTLAPSVVALLTPAAVVTDAAGPVAAAAMTEGEVKTPQRPLPTPVERPRPSTSRKAAKSPSNSRGRPHKSPKEKTKKKKKARRRILDSESEDDSDPDFMDSS